MYKWLLVVTYLHAACWPADTLRIDTPGTDFVWIRRRRTFHPPCTHIPDFCSGMTKAQKGERHKRYSVALYHSRVEMLFTSCTFWCYAWKTLGNRHMMELRSAYQMHGRRIPYRGHPVRWIAWGLVQPFLMREWNMKNKDLISSNYVMHFRSLKYRFMCQFSQWHCFMQIYQSITRLNRINVVLIGF